jgi:hypothetical protein
VEALQELLAVVDRAEAEGASPEEIAQLRTQFEELHRLRQQALQLQRLKQELLEKEAAVGFCELG